MERPDIEAALERAIKASKGPWVGGDDPRDPEIRDSEGTLVALCNDHKNDAVRAKLGEDYSVRDGAFISNARTDVQELAEYALHMEAMYFSLRVELENLRINRD